MPSSIRPDTATGRRGGAGAGGALAVLSQAHHRPAGERVAIRRGQMTIDGTVYDAYGEGRIRARLTL